jgi:hypothetical protein
VTDEVVDGWKRVHALPRADRQIDAAAARA